MILITIAVNALLLMAAFLSANLALAWGELGSYDIHGDKSGLAGLGAVPMLMAARWVFLAIGLAVALHRGLFRDLPLGRGLGAGLTFALHLGLGIVSYRGLEWVVGAIQASNPSPLRLAWVFGLLLPLPAFAAAFWGVNRGWIGRHPWLAAIVVGLFGWGQIAAWRQGYIRPTRPPSTQGTP